MEKNPQLIAARRRILNSHYSIGPKLVFDCAGWFGVRSAIFEKELEENNRLLRKLDGQIAMAQRLHEKRPDLYPEPDYAGWFDVFSRILRKNKPQTFYISSANYTGATKFLLEGVANRFTKRPPWEESQWKIIDDPIGIDDWVKKAAKYCYCQADVDATLEALRYFNQIKSEETKMEAKKCERCGKLYELKDAGNYIDAYMPGLPVNDHFKENFTESRIKKENTRVIYVNYSNNEVVDLCPECREKLKDFFESGNNSGIAIKPAEE